ncbi:MAG: YhfC family intramembrane metalloprotease [Chloroflexi bacterium]|nr:YhfC family intramembrane metalloprotease [Chloroflexota bacterium]
MYTLYITHALNGILMIALGVGLGFALTRRFNAGWRLWWIGGGVFVLSQVGHIPFNIVLTTAFQRGWLPSPPPDWYLPFNAVVLGLSAGLWEEILRWAGYRWWAKDARTSRKGALMGAGHGGMEAILLGVMVLLTFGAMTAIRNLDLSTLVPAEQLGALQQQVSAYWSIPWYLTLVGALERAFTLVVHISFSVLVLQGFLRSQARWLWLAVLWHALVDAAAVYGAGAWGVYNAEILVALAALISLWIIKALWQPEPMEVEQALPAQDEVLPGGAFAAIEETERNLDESRFDQ